MEDHNDDFERLIKKAVNEMGVIPGLEEYQKWRAEMEYKALAEGRTENHYHGDSINIKADGDISNNAIGSHASLRDNVLNNSPITIQEIPIKNKPELKPAKNVFGNAIAMLGIIISIITLIMAYFGCHH
jgi:hypothetical protein